MKINSKRCLIAGIILILSQKIMASDLEAKVKISDLPVSLLSFEILPYLSAKECVKISRSNKSIHNIITNPIFGFKKHLREGVQLNDGSWTTWPEAINDGVTSKISRFNDLSYLIQNSPEKYYEYLWNHEDAIIFVTLHNLYTLPNFNSEINITKEVIGVLKSYPKNQVVTGVKDFVNYLRRVENNRSQFQSARFLSLITIFHPELCRDYLKELYESNIEDPDICEMALYGLIISDSHNNDKYSSHIKRLTSDGAIAPSDVREYIEDLLQAGISPEKVSALSGCNLS